MTVSTRANPVANNPPVIPIVPPGVPPQAMVPPTTNQGGATTPRTAPGPFALAPALAIQGTIDMGSPDGRKTYRDATIKLTDPLYDCMSTGLSLFLNSLKRRAQNYGWTAPTGILQVPQDPLDPASPRTNLITTYGDVTNEMLQAFDVSYMNANCRQAQDNHMLFECLMDSLSTSARRKLALREGDYVTDGRYSGPKLLKAIIKASRLDTNASSGMIRGRLGRLAEYMETVADNDVEVFNDYVRGQIEALAARGEFSTDLLTNLFKGYASAKDHRFRAYIEEKQSRYDDGQHYTENELMDLAETRYAILLDKGLWNKPSQEQEQLLVMQTKLESMAQQSRQRTGKRGGESAPPLNKPNEKRRAPFQPAPEWKDKNIRPTDLSKKQWWVGRWWSYCTEDNGGHCNRWVCHKPSDCTGKPRVRPEHTEEAHNKPRSKVKFEKSVGPSARTRSKKDAMVSAISAELNDDSDEDSEASHE